jgi:hypothetical protein
MVSKKTSKNIELIEDLPIKLEKSKSLKKSEIREIYSSESSEEEVVIKPKRVQTEKQIEAFKLARQKLAEKRSVEKLKKDKEIDEYNKFKTEKLNKKIAKKEKKQKAEIEALETSSDDEPIVVKKKKSKKIIYVSDDDEPKKKEPINIIINNTTPTPQENKPKGKFSVFL